MPGLDVTVNIGGDKEFMGKLVNLAGALVEWRGALQDVGRDLKEYYSTTAFESRGGVFGTPWAGLSASTQAQKSKHYRTYASVPLMRTGKMKGSFYYKTTPTSVEIGNKVPYFKYHQSTAERHKIPRRPMMGVNNDVKGMVRRAFAKAMLAKVAGL